MPTTPYRADDKENNLQDSFSQLADGTVARNVAVFGGADTKYKTNNMDETSTASVTYVGQEDSEANYLILKVDETSDTEITYATIVNNPTKTTYALAWTDRLTLDYKKWNEVV